MAKLPLPARQTKALLATVATVVGPKVVEYLQDPERTRQLQLLVTSLRPTLRRRTPEGRLDAKIDALRAHLNAARPGELDPERVDAWRRRLDALDAKRALVVGAYDGRQRGKQLKLVSQQVDDLLLQFLTEADDTIGTPDGKDAPEQRP